MAENSKIEWCHHTFNAWTGCTKVSPACDHCYAESWAKRSGHVKWGHGEERRRTTAEYWRNPRKWDAHAKALGERHRVFSNSLSDVFDNEVSDALRDDLLDLAEDTPNLDWLLLTKRPQVAAKYARRRPLPDNVWLGATVENQAMANVRIPILHPIKARVHFLSMEPLLERVYVPDVRIGIDWIVVGGESGPHARDMDPQWARELRDTCRAAGVAFFMKQMTRKAPIPDDLMVREFPSNA